jgi:secreted trypsin-like serine protease
MVPKVIIFPSLIAYSLLSILADTCSGDSGSPLMMFSSNNQWILIGLTSYGFECAQTAYAGVYTRVAAYQDWINATMNVAYIQTPSILLHIFRHFLILLVIFLEIK